MKAFMEVCIWLSQGGMVTSIWRNSRTLDLTQLCEFTKFLLRQLLTTWKSWLHHANVDRLAAMWQAIWQDVYLPASGASDPYGNYALNPGTTVYPSTPLRPFWRSNSQGYWDSNSVRSTAAFGYTYPELNDWSRNSVQQRSDAAAAANVLYGPFSFSMKRDNTDLTPRQQWFATVSCKKFALDSSYSIILFLGSPPADIKDWYTASNLVAVMPVFVPPQVPGTRRPTPNELTTNSEYLLDDALDKAGMYDRSAEILEPYLHEKLTWRILKVYCKPHPATTHEIPLTLSSSMAAKLPWKTYKAFASVSTRGR